MRILLLIVITIVVGDLNYTAAQDAHNESNCFLIEVESECDTDGTILNLVPELPVILIAVTFNDKPEHETALASEQYAPANQSPHGWHVPIFVDDCVYRL